MVTKNLNLTKVHQIGFWVIMVFILIGLEHFAYTNQQNDCPIGTEITIKQVITGEGIYRNTSTGRYFYIPGKQVSIEITFTKNVNDSVLAMGFTCNIPKGWKYLGVNGTASVIPPIKPQAPFVSDGVKPLEFAWISVPTFPFSISLTVAIPPDATGETQIVTQAQYRFTGGQICSNVEKFVCAVLPGNENNTTEGDGTSDNKEGAKEGEMQNITERYNDNQKGDGCGVSLQLGCNTSNSKMSELRKVLIDLLFVGLIVLQLNAMKEN